MYSRKIWRGIKFGGLAVYNYYNRQIKIRQNFLLPYNIIRMAIPYRTAKFKSANILVIAIWGSVIFCIAAAAVSYYQNTDKTVQTQPSWLHGFSGCILVNDIL